MKATIITGLVAAVMALSVFSTAGFAYTMPSSADVASQLVASGFTTYSTDSVQGNSYTLETWSNVGSITSFQSVDADSGFWFMPASLQVSEQTTTTGRSSVDQYTSWTNANANAYNAIQTSVLTHAEDMSNFGTGSYGYSADTTGATTFISGIGINAPTVCTPAKITLPTWPTCTSGHC